MWPEGGRAEQQTEGHRETHRKGSDGVGWTGRSPLRGDGVEEPGDQGPALPPLRLRRVWKANTEGLRSLCWEGKMGCTALPIHVPPPPHGPSYPQAPPTHEAPQLHMTQAIAEPRPSIPGEPCGPSPCSVSSLPGPTCQACFACTLLSLPLPLSSAHCQASRRRRWHTCDWPLPSFCCALWMRGGAPVLQGWAVGTALPSLRPRQPGYHAV